jgi:DNA-binding transcriptional ArsR family regulator/energy-coupling factor transporter ATP-binding protein EcfA2
LYHLFEVKPRVGVPRVVDWGPRFGVCHVYAGGRLRFYAYTPLPRESVAKVVEAVEVKPEDLHAALGGGILYYTHARLTTASDFYYKDYHLDDIPGVLVSVAPSPAGAVCIAASREEEVDDLLASHKDINVKRRMGESVYILRFTLIAPSGQELARLKAEIGDLTDVRERWVGGRLRSFGVVRTVRELVARALEPPRVGLLWRLKARILGPLDPACSWERLKLMVAPPDPSRYPVEFARGSPLPELMMPEGDIRIGVTPAGKVVSFSVEHLKRHVYVVGQTGTGKTSLLKLLVHRLAERGGSAVIVVDPHGDMAAELARELPNSLFLDPIRSPFGLNPLDLPAHENRDYAVTLAIDILLEMFTDIFKLVETAVNVRYMLQVVMRALYSKSDSPTLGDLYNTILALHAGQLDLDVQDLEWVETLQVLRDLPEQTFISALSRLEPYAKDPLLRKVTSRTTLDMNRILAPGSVTIFSLPKATLGENLSRLLASTIVLKLWFEVLARARLGEARSPVFLVVDEFQFVSDLPVIETILSEARKYGLHLVMAHQHLEQLPEELLQSVLTNTGVKVVFSVGGGDVKRLSQLDADFAKTVARAVTALPVGSAVVKVSALPGEPQAPPIVVKVDYVEHRPLRFDIYTRELDPGEPRAVNVRELLNPVLKYLDELPDPVALQALYHAYRAGRDGITITDLALALGARKEAVEVAVAKLNSMGYVSVERVSGRRVVHYRDGLFRGVETVARSPEGRALARAAIKGYMARGWIAVAAKQDPAVGAKPDLIAIPVDRATHRPMYSKAVAVEVESCVEVQNHPDQVARNMLKESVRDFAEVHVWVPERCAGRVREILAIAKPEKPVKVVVVKPKPRKPRPAKPAVHEEEEGEATATTKPRFEARLQVLAGEAPAVEEVEVDGKRLRVDSDCWQALKAAIAKGGRVKYRDGSIVFYDNRGYPKMKCRAEEAPATQPTGPEAE